MKKKIGEGETLRAAGGRRKRKSLVCTAFLLCVCICQVRRMAAMSPPVDRTHKHITSLALLPPPPTLYSSRAVFRSSTTLGDDFFLFFLLFTQTHLFSLCLSAAAVVAEAAAAAATTLQKSSAYIKD